MRKILIVLALLIGLLVPITLTTASPASADVTCSSQKNMDSYKSVSHFGDYTFHATVTYKSCIYGGGDTFARVFGYSFSFSGDGCGIWGEGWRYNPNVIGGWNPGEWETNNCSSGQNYWNAPGDFVKVNASDPASDRCIGATVVQKLGPARDDYEFQMPSMCIV